MVSLYLRRHSNHPPSLVTTGTLEILLVTISSITSNTMVSILHRTKLSYVPSLISDSGLRSMSVSATFMEMNLRMRYWVMTLTTMFLADSLSYDTRGIRRALDINCLRSASYRTVSGDAEIVSGALTLRILSTSVVTSVLRSHCVVLRTHLSDR